MQRAGIEYGGAGVMVVAGEGEGSGADLGEAGDVGAISDDTGIGGGGAGRTNDELAVAQYRAAVAARRG